MAWTRQYLLILFNRPDTTERAFAEIRRMRPLQLFLAADGPRAHVPTDTQNCEMARAVVAGIDWPCSVRRRFLDENQGCGRGVAGAITWALSQVEEAIILEDDCLPHPSFFRYAEELLRLYRDEPRLMHISGSCFLRGGRRGASSYYFSRWTHNWGWATWRRAWKEFDIDLVPEPDRSHNWDAQWRLSVRKCDGLAAAPNVNLVTNIGCGRPDATHTVEACAGYMNLPVEEMPFPLVHPARIRPMDHYFDYSVLRNDNSVAGLLTAPIRIGARSLLRRLMPESTYDSLKATLRRPWPQIARPKR